MRPIDADAVFRWYVETFSEKNIGERAMKPNEIRFSMNDIRDNLDNMPTIDAVPVVRCKDCKHRDPEDKKCDCGHDIRWQLPRDDDWFCKDGERRIDAN